MIEAIPNSSLRLNDIPAPEADWSEIGKFALTFSGYDENGLFEHCAKIANAKLDHSLTGLRTCLFFEQRRWRHFGDDPDAVNGSVLDIDIFCQVRRVRRHGTQLRVEYPGAIYHVMNRGDRRESIFRDHEDRHCFLRTLGEACDKMGWQVYALCLMGNRFPFGEYCIPQDSAAGLVSGKRSIELVGQMSERLGAEHTLKSGWKRIWRTWPGCGRGRR